MEEADRDTQILVLHPFAAFQSSSRLKTADLSRAQGLIKAIKQEGSREAALSPIESEPLQYIPWHISNRYYEADVHFKISNLNFSDALKTKRPSQARRAVRMTASNGEGETAGQVEEDGELQERVRNVFEALEKPRTTSAVAESSSVNDERSEKLLKEIEGVDAVMMIIDQNKSLGEHQRLLSWLNSMKGDRALLSGFDFAISLVVALPLPLDLSHRGSNYPPPSSEAVGQLYTAEGWEYIDLDEKNDISDLIDEEQDEDETESETLETEGTEGIERIREALETHTWPGLSRKNDRRGKFARESSVGPLEPDSQSVHKFSSVFDDQSTDRTLASLRSAGSTQFDHAITAEPTEQDEALAQAFLKKMLASQGVDSMEPLWEQNKPTKTIESMKEELERFLETQDTDWPLPAENLKSSDEDEKDAWQVDRNYEAPNASDAFEDDFTDFVAGQEKHSFSQQSDNRPDTLFEEELDFDLDDIALMKALEGEGSSSGASRDIGGNDLLDFESTLSAVLAQAERVRSITDHEKRREEAARVALALVREQP